MPLHKRILFYLCIAAASFVLLNGVVFLIHAVYRPPSWKLLCDAGECIRTEDAYLADVNSIYRSNVQGSFYLIAIMTLILVPFVHRKELFPPLLYSFGAFATGFAFLATRGKWFFEVGSDTPETLPSVLLFLICICSSYLLYRRAEVVLDSSSLTCDVVGRTPLTTAKKK